MAAKESGESAPDKPLSAVAADEFPEKDEAELLNLLRGSGGRKAFKAILIGELHTGKTTLFLRLCGKDVKVVSSNITGIDYVGVTRTVNGMDVKILYFDTAGMETHKYSLSNQYYRQTDAVLYCYDTLDETTIGALPNWDEDVHAQCTRPFLSFLVGTKSDLSSQKPESCVSSEITSGVASQLRCTDSYRVSSVTGEGVEDMLVSIAGHIQTASSPREVHFGSQSSSGSTKKGTCC